MKKTIELRYYALLRERVGVAGESVQTEAARPAELFDEMARRHGLQLPRAAFRAAVNDAFCAWDHPLADGDVVSFIPPVSGG